jgi:hypothetical protein
MAVLNLPVVVFLLVVVLAIYKFLLYPTFISPLSKIPNAHWTAPVSPLWILWTRFSSHENRNVHAAHLKLGPVIRLAPNELSINDVAGLRTVYAGGFEKGQWYSIFDNYGYVWPHLRSHSNTDLLQGSVHVFLLAFPSPLSTQTHDLKHLL